MKGLKRSFMTLTKVAGALQSPNGITIHSNNPYLVGNFPHILLYNLDLVITTTQIQFGQIDSIH